MTPTATPTAPEVTLPTRDEIATRMQEAVADGQELSSLTRSGMLGIPDARITVAEATVAIMPPALDTIYSRSRAALPLSVDRGTHLAVAGKGGRAAILALVNPFFESNDYHGVLEISPAPGDTGLVENVPSGMLCVQFPDGFTGVTMRAYGHEYKYADPTLIDRFRNADRWTLVNLPAEANTALMRGTTHPYGDSPHPVAAVRDDGKSIVIFLSLFSTPSGQFVRTATNLGNAYDLFKIIMLACQPLLTGAWQRPTQDPMVEQIRAAVRTFETMRALAAGSMQRIEDERLEAVREVEQLESRIEQYRESLMNALRDQDEVRQRAEVLGSGSEGRILAGMTEAFRAMTMIENHRGIKDLQFLQVSGNPVMRIQTKDFVFNSRESGTRRFCKGIRFDVNMETRNVTSVIKFHNPGAPEGQGSIHPHINGSRGCFGAAETALWDAIGRKDWVSAVSFVLGWMLQYNHGSPYTERRHFPADDRQVGWVEG